MIDLDGVQVETANELPCLRCGGQLLCVARVPHSFLRSDGYQVCGGRLVGLCPACDRGEPAALGLIAFFTLHSGINDYALGEAGHLIFEWLSNLLVVDSSDDQ